MDSSFTIKPSPGVGKTRALRDPVPVREAVETELVGSRTVAAAGDGGSRDDNSKDGGSAKDQGQRAALTPQDVVADPNSREVIYRERDVRNMEREHPDQALLRQRAYHRLTPAADEAPQPLDPHADIKA